MKAIVTFGEMMLRLMPSGHERIEQAHLFSAYYGGDESIVATSLARFGLPVRYITKLPENSLGMAALTALRGQGVDASFVAIGGDRLGLNFYETGASIRPSRVIYDRRQSAFATSDPKEFAFETAFSEGQWFHVSGITPALSPACLESTRRALRLAKEFGMTVSFDLNYRRSLWSPEEARSAMDTLVEYIDVCIGNEEDAQLMLGMSAGRTDVTKGYIDDAGFESMLRLMRSRFGFSLVALTLRESRSASDNGWSSIVFDGHRIVRSQRYDIHLVDRGGGGAAFSAGMIYGLVTGMDLTDTVTFATAASALKQTVVGDFNMSTVEEVLALSEGAASGRVER